jgi:hypothetical protein
MSSRSLNIAIVIVLLVLGMILISSNRTVSGVMEYFGSAISQLVE